MNELFGFLGATEHLRLIGVAAALVAVALAWRIERGPFRSPAIRLSVAVPWVVGAAGLLLLGIAEWRYSAHRAPLDLIEAQFAIVSWAAQSGQGLYDIDPARRVVGVTYGPPSYALYSMAQAVFGPSMVPLKLAAAACTLVGILLTAVATVRMAGRVAGSVAASLVIAALASGGVFFLLVRSDPLLLLLIGVAAFLSSIPGRLARPAMVVSFAVTGVMALIKPNIALALWSILLLVHERAASSGRGVFLAVLRAGVAALLGSCVAVALQPRESYELARLLLDVASSVPIRSDLLAENLLLAGVPLALCTLLEVGTARVHGAPQWPALVAIIGCLAALYVGSIDGASDNHALLVLVMCMIWGASLWRRMMPRYQHSMRLGAMGLSVALVPALVGRTPSMLWQTRGDEAGTSRWIAEGQRMIRSFRGRVAVGLGDNQKKSYEAMLASPYLVYAGAEHRLDPMAVMIFRKMGTPAAAFRPLLVSPEMEAWILPASAAPFALDSWYGGEEPIFGRLERRAFASAFQPWCRGTHWTLWIRAGSAASRPSAECAGVVLVPPA